MDVNSAESVRQLMDIEAHGFSAEVFDDVFGEMFFAYPNSAGVVVPLVEGGVQRRVTFTNAREFAQSLQAMRLSEATEQAACIRQGMATVIPIDCLSLWHWRDLERRVCGDPTIDVALLKRKTTYEGLNEQDQLVTFLWKALESFGQADLRLFLRFCWGRSRLPAESSPLWVNGFKVALAEDLHEASLPRGHTCFFQIDLPRYTSAADLESRVLYAVRNCTEMSIA